MTSSSTHTMDKPLDKHVHKILPFSDVHGAVFLGNDQLVIKTNNSAVLTNLTPDIKDLTLVNYNNPNSGWMRTNQEKTAVVLYCNSPTYCPRTIIYDIKTKERYYKNLQQLEDIPVFTNTAHTVAVEKNNEWLLYNYVTKEEIKHMALNATAKKMFIDGTSVQYNPTKNHYSFIAWDNVITHDLSNNNHLYTLYSRGFRHYKYSPDGCLLACFGPNGSHGGEDTLLYNISGDIATPLLKNIDLKTIFFTFHPSSAFGVIYTYPDNTNSEKFIEYWNVEKNKCIAKQQLISEQKTPLYAENNNSSFSADGTLLAVSFEERCVIYIVPFEVIGKKAYPLKTKEKMIPLLWLLKNYTLNNKPLLPEIAQLLVQNTFAVSELTGD